MKLNQKTQEKPDPEICFGFKEHAADEREWSQQECWEVTNKGWQGEGGLGRFSKG